MNLTKSCLFPLFNLSKQTMSDVRNHLQQRMLCFLKLTCCLFYGVLCIDEKVDVCDGQTSARTLFVQPLSNVEVKYCVRSQTKLLETIFINSRLKKFGNSDLDNIYVTVKQDVNNTMSDYHVVVHVKNVTTSDFISHSVIIHNVNDSQITLRLTLKRPGIIFTKSRTIGNIYENQDIKMLCERSAEDEKELRIYKLYEETKRLDTFMENNKLVYEISSTRCTDMGRYVCEAEDSRATLDIEILNCPPVVCTSSETDGTYTTDISHSLSINFCVIAITTIKDTVAIDNVEYEIGTHYSNLYVNRSNDRIYHFIEIEYMKITQDDLTSHVANVATEHGNFNYTFRLQKKDLLSLSLITNMSAILCVSSQYPKSVSLYKVDTLTPLVSIMENVDSNESLTIRYQLSTEVCSALGTYECNSVNDQGMTALKTLQFVPPECPPILCLDYPNTLKTQADANVPTILNYCIVDYHKLQDEVFINGTSMLVNTELQKRTANIRVTVKEVGLYHYLTIVIHNLTESLFGIWKVTVISNSSTQLNFSVNIVTKEIVTESDKDNSSKTLLAISVSCIVLSTLFLAISIWLLYFKEKFKLYKILPSSVTSSRVQLPMY
ncbi:hypothetical protein Btru_043122 [Bulinus truncatus]|nr:hypothetical protein Btru_043122 [Bulinus truncatus]